MMSQFAILTRLKEPENSSLYSKMLVYDGENLKDTDPRAKSYQEYRDYAGVDEGMSGVSTRFAFKIISKVFNFDSTEVAANPVHLMYVLEQQIQREQFPPELEQKYTAFIKEHLGVRYAEFIGKEIQTAYLESYSEYGQNIFDRYVTYADYWIQDHEYRDTDTGEVFDRSCAECRAGEDREARRHRQPEGLPQRDRQLRAARAGQQRRQQPAVDELREAAHGDREEDVQQHRRAVAGDQLQRQGQRRRGQEARGLRHPHGGQGLHQQAGAAAVRVVPARAQEQLMALQSIIDRRLAGKNKSVGNRERFLRRHKEQVRDAVKRAIDGRSIRDVERGEEVHIPKKDLSEPVFGHGQGGIREVVHPGNKDFIRGDRIERPKGGGGGGSGKGEASDSGEGEDDFVFQLSKEEFMQVFFEDLALPNLVRTQLAETPEWKSQRAGYSSDGTPNNLHVVRSMRGAIGRRIAIGAGSRAEAREMEEELEGLVAGAKNEAVLARIKELEAAIAALRVRIARIPYLDPIDLRYRSRIRVPVPTSKAVMFCLMDISGSMDEARKDLSQALLHPAVPVPDAALREDRPGLHPPPHPGAGGRARKTSSTPARPAARWCPARWC